MSQPRCGTVAQLIFHHITQMRIGYLNDCNSFLQYLLFSAHQNIESKKNLLAIQTFATHQSIPEARVVKSVTCIEYAYKKFVTLYINYYLHKDYATHM